MGCHGKALKRAIGYFLETDAGTLKNSFNFIVDSVGKRTPQPKDDSQLWFSHYGISDVGRQSIVDLLPDWFSKAFDYRNVASRYAFNVLNADAGRKVCIAILGLTSRPSDDRNPRFPAASIARGKLLEKANADEGTKDAVCFDPLFEALVAEIGPTSPLVSTFLSSWNAVSEPDLRAPTKKAIADAYALWNAEQAKLAKREEQASRQRPTPSRSTAQSTANKPRCINPATGLPMMATDGSCGGVDVMGNPFGMKLR
jgi:hypothetical protein